MGRVRLQKNALRQKLDGFRKMALRKKGNKHRTGYRRGTAPIAKHRVLARKRNKEHLRKTNSLTEQNSTVNEVDCDDSCSTEREFKRVKKNHIPTHGKLTAKHVKDVLFHLHQNVEANIKIQLRECQELKTHINDWARSRIKAIMLSEAVAQNIMIKGKVVSKFTQIGEAYRRDESTRMHNKIHAVLYKQFQEKPYWRKELEEEYMDKNDMCYEDEETQAIGFVRALITEQYSEVKRSITDRAKKAHGTFVRIRKQPKKNQKKNDENLDRAGEIASDEELVDTDDTESTEEKPPRLSKSIFHSSYIRVEKKVISKRGKQQWVASPKSRVISYKEYKEFQGLRGSNSALQAKLIQVMEQNSKLRSALTAHSIAIPANLQDKQDSDDQDDKHHEGSDESTVQDCYAATGKDSRDANSEKQDDDEGSHERIRGFSTSKFAFRKKDTKVSSGIRRHVRVPGKKNVKYNRTIQQKMHWRSRSVTGLKVHDDSSESSFSVCDDFDESEESRSESSQGSMFPREKQRKGTTRVSVGGKYPSDKKHSRDSTTKLFQQAMPRGGQHQDKDDEVSNGSSDAEGSSRDAPQATFNASLTGSMAPPEETKRSTGKQWKSVSNANLKKSKVTHKTSRVCPIAKSLASSDNKSDSTVTEEDDEEYFSKEPKLKEAIDDDELSWSVDFGGSQDGFQDLQFSDSDECLVSQKEPGRPEEKQEMESEKGVKHPEGSTRDIAAGKKTKNRNKKGTPTISGESKEGHDLSNALNMKDKEEAGCETPECVYEHGDYNMGTTYYAIEDPKELLFVLEGLRCKICEIDFGGEKGEWKPGQKTPVYACHGMRCGDRTCEWAVCGCCFGKEQLKRVDEQKTVRTRRRT